MQVAIIILNLFLSVIGLVCIHLETYKNKQNLRGGIKKIVLPGTIIGAVTSAAVFYSFAMVRIATGILLGILTGETLCILYLIAKNAWKEEKATAYYDDGIPPKYFVTGDKHRDFGKVKRFCRDVSTRKKDVLIILGDAGFNYFEDVRDSDLKKQVSRLNITLFCIHGNKENRPQNVGTYGIRSFCGGKVYYEPKYPNILFAVDGDIYTFEGKKYMVVGGAHSVDKARCLEENKPFWEDEMPDDAVKAKVEERLESENNIIYGMMTHTCPIDYLPTEMFISTRQNLDVKAPAKKEKAKKVFNPDIDRSTEEWLGNLEKKLNYEIWYCGHYHIDKQIDKVHMMCHEIMPLHWE